MYLGHDDTLTRVFNENHHDPPATRIETARSQAKREETPGGSDITAEEEPLAALLGTNQDLVDVLKFSSSQNPK